MFGLFSEMTTVSPNSTMLPPICVAACDSQRRRNGGLRKTESAPSPDPSASLSSASASSGTPVSVTWLGRRGSCARGRVGRECGGDRGITAFHEPGEPAFERRALDQHMSSTRLAAQPDVCPETVDEPGVAAAGMRLPETHDIAEQQIEDRTVRHGGEGIRGVDAHGSGRVAGPLRGRRCGRAASPRRLPRVGSPTTGR